MGLFGGTGWTATLNVTRHASCCVSCAQITSGTSQSVHTYLCVSFVFFLVVLAPWQRSHLWSSFTVHSAGFSWGKIAPGISSSFSFTFSCFFSFNSTQLSIKLTVSMNSVFIFWWTDVSSDIKVIDEIGKTEDKSMNEMSVSSISTNLSIDINQIRFNDFYWYRLINRYQFLSIDFSGSFLLLKVSLPSPSFLF